MSAGKRIIFGNDARDGILQGIKKCAATVLSTYGPRGRYVVHNNGSTPFITKDGINSLKRISFSNELEETGAALIKEASSKANHINGDGSTGTAILTSLFCSEANRLIKKGMDASDIRDGYIYAMNTVLKQLSKLAIKIHKAEDIYNIAKISANNDDDIAKIVSDAFTMIGDDGVISITDSLSPSGKSEVLFNTGCDFDKGFVSSIGVDKKTEALELDDPLVLMVGEAVDNFDDLINFVKYAESIKKPLVVIAPIFGENCSAGFYEKIEKRVISGCLIMAPGVSNTDIRERMTDLAVLLNAKILKEDVTVESFKLSKHFGTCKKLVVRAKRTEVITPSTNEELLEKHIASLKARTKIDKVDEMLTEFEVEKIKDRIARLRGGIATIYVGSRTTTELSEKKDRYDDAVNAVRAAIQEGMLPGGSWALYKVATDIMDKLSETSTTDTKQASIAFLEALQMPAKLLIQSTGRSVDKVVAEVMKKSFSFGYNSKTMQVVDLVKEGIVDPLKVIKNSIIYAENVAESFMMIDCAVVTELGSLTIEKDAMLHDDFFRGIK